MELKFNWNQYVYVKLTDKGIAKIVEDTNTILPFQFHTCYREVKDRVNSKGFHEFQFHAFLEHFGSTGSRLTLYIEGSNLYFNQKDLEPII